MPLLRDASRVWLGTTPVDKVMAQGRKVWPPLPVWFGPGQDPGALDSSHVLWAPIGPADFIPVPTTVTTTNNVTRIEWTQPTGLAFAIWNIEFPDLLDPETIVPHLYDGEPISETYDCIWLANKITLGPGLLPGDWAVGVFWTNWEWYWYDYVTMPFASFIGGAMLASVYKSFGFSLDYNNPAPHQFLLPSGLANAPRELSVPRAKWTVTLIYVSGTYVVCPPNYIDIDWNGTAFRYGNSTDTPPALPGA